MITTVQGDLFDYPADIRVNTVNCVGIMGKGVALAAKTRFPKMFEAYRKACLAGEVKPGKLNIWKTDSEWIVNFPTKRHWRDNSRYEDIEAGLSALCCYLRPLGAVRVALPALGCGHGGLDWSRVLPMIRTHLADLEATIFVFEPKASVQAGQRYSTRRGGKESGSRVNPVRVAYCSDTYPGNVGVSCAYVLGEAELLLRPALSVVTSSKSSPAERIAVQACIGAIAHPGVVIASTYDKPEWRSLSDQVLSKGAASVVWTAGGIGRVKVPSDLLGPMANGRIAFASLAEGAGRAAKPVLRQTHGAFVALARAILVACVGLDRDAHEIVQLSRGKPTFFVQYRDAFEEDAAWLRSVGAQPLGRRSSDLSPNVTALLQSLGESANP